MVIKQFFTSDITKASLAVIVSIAYLVYLHNRIKLTKMQMIEAQDKAVKISAGE